MSKLLIDDYPIQVLPKLATAIGLNEAIFVQQLHYWISGKSGKAIQGKRWIYNTYDEWIKQFPFWSKSTIRRTISSCEKLNVVIAGNYNHAGFDNTKWYTVNYDEINRLSRPSVQNGQTECSKWASATVQNEQTNTIDYTETTTETNSSHQSASRYDDDSDYMRLSKLLFNLIKQRNPKHREPNFQNWADDIRKLAELDKQSIKDIEKVIEWCQQDNFWQNNILSPAKLRKQFDQLTLKMNANKPKPFTVDGLFQEVDQQAQWEAVERRMGNAGNG